MYQRKLTQQANEEAFYMNISRKLPFNDASRYADTLI